MERILLFLPCSGMESEGPPRKWAGPDCYTPLAIFTPFSGSTINLSFYRIYPLQTDRSAASSSPLSRTVSLPSGTPVVPLYSVGSVPSIGPTWSPNCHPMGSLSGSSSWRSGKGRARRFPHHCSLSLAAARSRYKPKDFRSSSVLG